MARPPSGRHPLPPPGDPAADVAIVRSEPPPQGERASVAARDIAGEMDRLQRAAAQASEALIEARAANERLAADNDRLRERLREAESGRDAAVRELEGSRAPRPRR